jgi:hypothetical protein
MKIAKKGAPRAGRAANRSSTEEAEPARVAGAPRKVQSASRPVPGWLEYEVVPDDLSGINPACAQFVGTFSERSRRRRNFRAAAMSGSPRRFTNVGDDSPVERKNVRNLPVA